MRRDPYEADRQRLRQGLKTALPMAAVLWLLLMGALWWALGR